VFDGATVGKADERRCTSGHGVPEQVARQLALDRFPTDEDDMTADEGELIPDDTSALDGLLMCLCGVPALVKEMGRPRLSGLQYACEAQRA